MNYAFEPIGFVHSCYKEKFGIPRQAGLVREAQAEIHFPLHRFRDAFTGLEQFSHLWVIFIFHEAKTAKIRVRPPRMGGAKKLGVFATRSPHRPCPIGISAVELNEIKETSKEIILRIRGADLLDGTPVLDIKPYIRYADSIPRARSGWADQRPRAGLRVSFSKQALLECEKSDRDGKRGLKRLITGILKNDPRPAFQAGKEVSSTPESYAFKLEEFDVHWSVQNHRARVLELRKL